MQIRPTSGIHSTNSVNLDAQNSTQNVSSSDAVPTDQLELSFEAQMMSVNTTGSTIRADRVAELKAQIASGQYETSERLDAAVSRMLDEIA